MLPILLPKMLFYSTTIIPDAAKVLCDYMQNQRLSGISSKFHIDISDRSHPNLIDSKTGICFNTDSFKEEALKRVREVVQSGYKTLVLWSCGLGEVFNELVLYLDQIKVVLIEPEPDILFLLLQSQDCQKWISSSNLLIFTGPGSNDHAITLLNQYPSLTKNGLNILPGRILDDEDSRLLKVFQSSIETILLRSKQDSSTDNITPECVAFITTGAHKELLDVLKAETQAINWQPVSAIRAPKITQFLHSEEMLWETLGDRYPAIVLTFSLQTLLSSEWKKLKEKGIKRVFWCYDDPIRNVAEDRFFQDFDHIFCFDPIHSQRMAVDSSIPVTYLPAATTFSDGITGEKPEGIPDSLSISFVGSTGLQRMDGGVLNKISNKSGLFKTLFLFVKSYIDKGLAIPYQELMALRHLFTDKKSFEQTILLEDIVTYIQRVSFLSAISDLPLMIYGDEGWSEPQFSGRLKQNYAGKPADYLLETPWIYHNSLININLFNVQCLDSPTVRMLDVMACGGFLLTEYRPFIEKLFTIGEDLDVFRSREELREKLVFYRNYPQKCREIAQAGKEKIQKMHLYRHRLPLIFSTAGS